MLYTTWTYIGYDAVIFLAGLGNVSPELYEAARIDGAIKLVALPLHHAAAAFADDLLPLADRGHRHVSSLHANLDHAQRRPSQSSVDTLGVYIFRTISRNTDPNMGYGSAMAFVLFGVILLLTIFQNRIMGSKVFYG